jgi:hypothetical protein
VAEGNRCIFCGDPADSREHVFGKWLQKWVDADLTGGHQWSVTRYDASGNGLVVSPPVFEYRGGGPMTLKLPVVCAKRCNGGWMSRLEKSMEPWFGPMVQGGPTALSAERRRELALWAEKTAMVYETTEESTTTSTQDEREFIRLNQRPNPLTEVWLARNNAPTFQSRVRHFDAQGVLFGEKASPSGLVLPERTRLRWDVIGIGAVMLLVVGTTAEDARPPDIDLDRRLVKIWPSPAEAMAFPLRDKPWITDAEAIDLCNLAANDMDIVARLFRSGP